jgi:hypothetical protein
MQYNSSFDGDMSYEETLAFQQLMQRALQKITNGSRGWTSSLPVLENSGGGRRLQISGGSRRVTTYVKLIVPGNESHAQQAAEVLDDGNISVIGAALQSASQDITNNSFQANLTTGGLVLEEVRPVAVAGPTNFKPQRLITVSTRITPTSTTMLSKAPQSPQSSKSRGDEDDTAVVLMFVTAIIGLVIGVIALVMAIFCLNIRFYAKATLCLAPIAIVLPFIGLLQAYAQLEPDDMKSYEAEAWPICIASLICGILGACLTYWSLRRAKTDQANDASIVKTCDVRTVIVGSPQNATRGGPVERGVRRLSRRASQLLDMVLPGSQPYDTLDEERGRGQNGATVVQASVR